MQEPSHSSSAIVKSPTRRRELLTFFILAFGIWPIIAVGVVASYGFAVWIWQIIFGPPGPLGH
ncbi:periplasmic nitrate reductase, NapE protein [Rhizobium sp. LjRoot98]|uniref:periplasmic nitrate reductase, NapE protein n=1 Tax=unclassified Rhizobium TaxID=2613769 RepID=UPI0009E72EFB|nr:MULTISPECIES: periplasmic nitrate reductase, NapE protein [unclassified Rhizobium]